MHELQICPPELRAHASHAAACDAGANDKRPHGSMAARLAELEAWDEQENYQAPYGPQYLGPWGTNAETLE